MASAASGGAGGGAGAGGSTPAKEKAETETANWQAPSLPAEVLLAINRLASCDSFDEALMQHSIQLRRWIHAHPEPAFEEKVTREIVRLVLLAAGVEASDMTTMARTGLAVDLYNGDTSKPTFVLGYRADMDALRMSEDNAALAHRSTVEKCAHACGHDAHTTALLGAAVLLAKARASMPPGFRIRLIFQPAEEGLGGALEMVKAGVTKDLSEVYGLHNLPILPHGKVAIKTGAVMSHTATFEVTIRGTGGHGGMPATGTDTVVAAAHVIVAIQTIVSRNVTATDNAVVSVCTVHGGEASNVIPSVTKLSGTIRDTSPRVFDRVCQRLRTIVKSTCEAFEVEGEVDIDMSGYPAVINAAGPTATMARVAADVFGTSQSEAVTDRFLPAPGGDDFSYLSKEVPGCYCNLGTGEDGHANAMLHTPRMDFNDHAMPTMVAFWLGIAQDRMAHMMQKKQPSAKVPLLCPSSAAVTGSLPQLRALATKAVAAL